MNPLDIKDVKLCKLIRKCDHGIYNTNDSERLDMLRKRKESLELQLAQLRLSRLKLDKVCTVKQITEHTEDHDVYRDIAW